MEQMVYDMASPIGDFPVFPWDGLAADSLLDDEHILTLKKIQGDLNSSNVGQEVDDDLFPDLLPMVPDPDPLPLDWMETVDLSHFIDKTEVAEDPALAPVQCSLPITVQPEDIDLLQSLLQEASEQLTPPVSPPAQVAPEIQLNDLNFDQQTAWEVINSPLSPRDVESLLSPSSTPLSTSPSCTPAISPAVSSPPSPASDELTTIDSSPLSSDSSTSKKGRQKPYERSCRQRSARKELSYSEDPDFSFRADEKLSKRERKRLQNKNAATKYRMKKKLESTQIVSDEKQLEDRNKELKDKVEQLSREIACMKDVLGDIYKGLEAKARK